MHCVGLLEPKLRLRVPLENLAIGSASNQAFPPFHPLDCKERLLLAVLAFRNELGRCTLPIVAALRVEVRVVVLAVGVVRQYGLSVLGVEVKGALLPVVVVNCLGIVLFVLKLGALGCGRCILQHPLKLLHLHAPSNFDLIQI